MASAPAVRAVALGEHDHLVGLDLALHKLLGGHPVLVAHGLLGKQEAHVRPPALVPKRPASPAHVAETWLEGLQLEPEDIVDEDTEHPAPSDPLLCVREWDAMQAASSHRKRDFDR